MKQNKTNQRYNDLQPEERLPPQAIDVEQTVVGSMLVDKKAAEKAIELLSDQCFYASVNRIMFTVMREMFREQMPIDAITLSSELKKRNLYEQTGEGTYIGKMAESICSPSNIEYYARILQDKAERRERIRKSYSDIEKAYDNNTPILTDEKRNTVNFLWEYQISNAGPIVKFCETGIIWPEGIGLLTGPAGKGKSNIILAAAASIVNPECDSLGFEIRCPAIHVDTENPLPVYHTNIRRALINRAGLREGDPFKNIEFVNIRGCETFEEKQNWLFGKMATEKYKLYMIDGAGDFVLDVNDTNTCIPFVSQMCAMTLRHGCAVLMTLHGNPLEGTEKARGVLGSELWRKADCSLLLKTDDGSKSITTDFSLGKNRNAKDELTQYFEWDDVKEMHVSTSTPRKKYSKVMKDREKILNLAEKPITYADLVAKIMQMSDVKERAARDRIYDVLAAQLMIKNENGLYQANITPQQHQEHWASEND